MKFRLYIDEVGNSHLESSSDPNHRFLSLTGVAIELGYVDGVLHPQLEAIKRAHFRSHVDDPVVLHRKEILNAKRPFETLRDPAIRSRFDNELIAAIASWQFTAITVCIDKKRHKETYTTWRYDPYHYCLAVMLERYVFLLREVGATGDVLAESRGGKADLRLKDSYRGVW